MIRKSDESETRWQTAPPIRRGVRPADAPEPQTEREEPPPKGAWGFTKRLVSQFVEDDAMTLAAAISFYTALSLAPLILVILAVAGAIWGRDAAAGAMVGQIGGLIGQQAAQLTEEVIAKAAESDQRGWAAAIGIFMLLFGATTLFAQLQYSLNRIWEVKAKPGRGMILFIRKRLLSLGMILALGFLLMVSLVGSAAIEALTGTVRGDLPGADALWHGVNLLFSAVVYTVLFAAIYKYLPDAKVPWRTVWIGAAVTAVLFIVGQQLIGLYLGRGGVGSTYGAAGSLLVVLVWVYYSAMVFFFGAEFTQVYAARTGHGIEPSKLAVREAD